ncbi:hypothetical protein GXP67_01830 [Rhodocytophaga rosea]|uniref:Uncharacterized protein n=1 Tax=Rhodocytophaga rosea TaxID=2704465 RepID=A0A6C0GC87_9BACT|nr:hypothetical protein [Rhodocytophaga rosea]QHT65498.1 hypothetical protein GXP67_01830 [Rhodocytophaga rosea]
MDKLQKLFKLCKSGVFIEYNEHKLYNDTVAEFLIGQEERGFIDTDTWDKMIERDTIVGIEFFPEASSDAHTVYHYDLEKALDKCLEIVANLQSVPMELSSENLN